MFGKFGRGLGEVQVRFGQVIREEKGQKGQMGKIAEERKKKISF